ncbi:DUF2802 domain-containing protein [Bowmanella denitrificans]|uniref:DUF2802 domain-containing protein n=1 Tax=Bowmanella denitrificans TaxID=366582 RepID=UPI000C9CF150|nr:DUF2802 domain-containing protein [Bowmanella denitrificans]
MGWIEIALTGTALLTLLLVLAVFRLRMVSQSRAAELAQIQAQLTVLEQKSRSLAAELHELRTGSIGMGERIKLLEGRHKQLDGALRETREQQQELAEMDPDTKLYNRAVKLLQQGASVEELMDECELPRAEAELLFSIHGKQR